MTWATQDRSQIIPLKLFLEELLGELDRETVDQVSPSPNSSLGKWSDWKSSPAAWREDCAQLEVNCCALPTLRKDSSLIDKGTICVGTFEVSTWVRETNWNYDAENENLYNIYPWFCGDLFLLQKFEKFHCAALLAEIFFHFLPPPTTCISLHNPVTCQSSEFSLWVSVCVNRMRDTGLLPGVVFSDV